MKKTIIFLLVSILLISCVEKQKYPIYSIEYKYDVPDSLTEKYSEFIIKGIEGTLYIQQNVNNNIEKDYLPIEFTY